MPTHDLPGLNISLMEMGTFQGLEPLPYIDNLSCSLQLCRDYRSLPHARRLHIQMCNSGLDIDRVLGNQLISLFVDCGALYQARQIFSRLANISTRSFASLIYGYVDNDCSEHAFELFQHMQERCVHANDYIFVGLLKACSKMRNLRLGLEIHHDICKDGYDSNPYVANTLVIMYGHCGALEEAQDIFDSLSLQDVISWNALLSVYVENGHSKEALRCLELMQLSGALPNVVTFICSLKACNSIRVLEKGHDLHLNVVLAGFEENLCICNALIDMYAKCGQMLKAEDVFNSMKIHDVISWNVLIEGYIEHGFLDQVLLSVDEMENVGLSPNAITFLYILKACTHLGYKNKGQETHIKIAKHDLEIYPFLCNALLSMYVQSGMFPDACSVFWRNPVRDIVSWTTLITGYAAHGFHHKAVDCMLMMQLDGISPNIVSWSAIILSYAERGEIENALSQYVLLQEQGVLPNHVTFIGIFKACGETGSVDIGRKFHALVCNLCDYQHFDRSSMEVSIVDMYGRCGSMDNALESFSMITVKGLVAWNALAAGYARQGDTARILCVLEVMKENDIHPDEISFVSILSACSHEGLLAKGKFYFQVMNRVYNIFGMTSHYTCLIDLLSRTGQLDEGLAVIERIFPQSDIVVWTSMLSACQKAGDIELSRKAFDNITKINEDHSATFLQCMGLNPHSFIRSK